MNIIVIYNYKSNDFFELQMKDLLEHIEKTWKMTQTGPERKILESYAEQTKTLTIQYASE